MAETAEPPVVSTPTPTPEYIPPQLPPAPKPKVNRGEVWKTQLDKLKKDELGESKPIETPPETPKEESKPEVKTEETPEVKPAATSPLDVVTAGKNPEVKVEEDDDDGFDENKTDWKRANELRKAQKREIKELKAKIQENEKAPRPDPEEITRLAQERDALKQSLAEREDLIKSVDVRLSDEYRTLAKKRDDTLGKIATRARSYGVDADMLVQTLALPESKFKNDQIKMIMSELEPDDKARITVLTETLEGHNEALWEFERDAPKKYEEIQAKRAASLREQQEQSIKTVHSEFGKVTETLPNDVVTLREVPDDVPGGTEWNQAIQKAKENALRILSPGGSDFNESAAIAVKGAHYDAVMNMFLKEHSELLDARKRLAEYDSGGPDFKGSNKPTTSPKLSPAEKFHKSLEALKASSPD